MNLSTLFKKANTDLFADKSYYKQIDSNQKEMLSFFGKNISITKITTQRIRDYITYLHSKGNKEATIQNKLTHLRTCLKHACNEDLLQKLPYIPTIKIHDKKFQTYDSKTVLSMLKLCKQHNMQELRKAILIAYYTGIRINNILTLQPENIENNYIRLWQNKTNNPYSVPIKKRIQSLFINFEPFTINYQQCYYQFTKIRKELGLPEGSKIHSFRHSMCSNLIEKDIPLPIAQKLMGHKDIQSTMVYVHIKNKQLEEAIKAL